MKYMIAWKIPPSSYKPAVEAFLSGGAPAPEGLATLGRWHVPGSASGWHLVEGSAEALAEHVAEWAASVELEVSPVMEDEAAANSLTKVYGK